MHLDAPKDACCNQHKHRQLAMSNAHTAPCRPTPPSILRLPFLTYPHRWLAQQRAHQGRHRARSHRGGPFGWLVRCWRWVA